MKSANALSGILALGLLAGCGGSDQRQADATQPAAQQTPPPAAATTDPTPTQPQPSTPAYQEPAPAQQPRPAQPRPTAPAYQQPTPVKPAPVMPTVHTVSVPSGTVLQLALDTGLNSKTAQAGDTFTATVLEPVSVDGRDVIPAGAKIEGTVTEAVAAKRGAGKAKLAMSFDVLTLPGGYKTNIVGSFQEVTESKKKRNAAIIGGSAAGGALLGRILGKDTKGAVVGAIVAGGIGTAVVMGQEGSQAKLPADTPFEIKLEEAVQVPHEPTRS